MGRGREWRERGNGVHRNGRPDRLLLNRSPCADRLRNHRLFVRLKLNDRHRGNGRPLWNQGACFVHRVASGATKANAKVRRRQRELLAALRTKHLHYERLRCHVPAPSNAIVAEAHGGAVPRWGTRVLSPAMRRHARRERICAPSRSPNTPPLARLRLSSSVGKWTAILWGGHRFTPRGGQRSQIGRRYSPAVAADSVPKSKRRLRTRARDGHGGATLRAVRQTLDG